MNWWRERLRSTKPRERGSNSARTRTDSAETPDLAMSALRSDADTRACLQHACFVPEAVVSLTCRGAILSGRKRKPPQAQHDRELEDEADRNSDHVDPNASVILRDQCPGTHQQADCYVADVNHGERLPEALRKEALVEGKQKETNCRGQAYYQTDYVVGFVARGMKDSP